VQRLGSGESDLHGPHHKPNGSGTANLSCGTGCGWDFNIQMAPDRSTFSLVDVSAANPGNDLAGVAVHQ
jgi:hypothetical protein